jgi:hypothetical protein
MKINRKNYEVWFLDFYEGRLSPEQIKELMGFLDLHYDLKEEFDSFENISLPPAKKVVFDSKNLLKKTSIRIVGDINEKNYDDFFIAYYEGDLDQEGKNNVLLFLEKNPSLKNSFELFSKVKTAPDKAIVFSAKESLKKKITVAVGSITEENYAEYFVAAMEGELTLQQHTELKEFLYKNPHLVKDYQLFGQTRLTVDTAIVFNRKEQLKKPVVSQNKSKVRILYYAVSAAASIIVLLAIYFMMNRGGIQKVNMAYRNIIEFKNHQVINNSGQLPDNSNAVDNSNNLQNYYSADSMVPEKENKTENTEYLYASALKTGVIIENNEVELSRITAYEDYYAMIMSKNDNKEQQNDRKDNGFMSLKDFALFNAKKAIAPEDKKDDVTPASKITGWDLAQAGVEQMGKLTGADAKLDRNENNKGFRLSLGENFEWAYNPSK